ncbi:MAG: ROK family protein [Bacteroidales bacterium]|nr:ROK family protein [Bacteroidales bacterium]
MNDNTNRVIMTLDAGGTNFVFSGMEDGREIVRPMTIPAVSDNSQACLELIAEGFSRVKKECPSAPVAISFAFPGPADYEHGIIGDLPNFPGFRGGVALGPYLENRFKIPVFINNDGNLFALGEAAFGILPEINAALEAAGSEKRYKNLLGITLGTGFGAGVVTNGTLLTGDNGCGGDVWLMRHPDEPELILEEDVSIRAVIRSYGLMSGEDTSGLTPKDIFDIAKGIHPGNVEAAKESFASLGRHAAHGIVHALDIVDGIVVIGGGLSGASEFFMPSLIQEARRSVATRSGAKFPCLQSELFDLTDKNGRAGFLKDESTVVTVPGTDKTTRYDSVKKTGIAISRLGASRAISLGAYAFAMKALGID